MRWRSLALGALAVLVVGCGATKGNDATGPTSTLPSATCLTDNAIEGSRTLAPVDFAGLGAPAGANFFAGSGACKNLLLATVDGKVRLARAPVDLSQKRVTLHAITVPGRKGQLLLAVLKHPRGGFQAYLFGYAGGELAQITRNGRPVVPFVASGSAKLATHCSRNGIQVDTAKLRSGLWTVYRTTYAITGTTATSKGRAVQRDGLDDAKLDQQYSSLIRHDLFEDCR